MFVVERLHAPTIGWDKIPAFAIVGVITAVGVLALVSLRYQQGAIQGRVEDDHGSAVSAATVTARRIVTGEVVRVETQADGSFVLPNITPGRYSVTVQAWGYTPVSIARIMVGSGEKMRREFVMPRLQ